VKSEGQLKQKAKQIIFRHRKAYVQRGLAKRPENCSHNRKVSLPVHMANRATLSVCGYCPDDGAPNNVVCDSTMGGDRQAGECPFFEARRTAEALKDEFNRKLGLNGHAVEIGYIAKEYPDVAALLWVMGPGKPANREAPPPEPENQGNILAFFGDFADELAEEPDDVPERPLVEDDDGGGT
jgi:hypothetical protein